MHTQRPFGLKVLTFAMANKLMPAVNAADEKREQKHQLNKLDQKMAEHKVDPTVAHNVLSWHQRQMRRNNS